MCSYFIVGNKIFGFFKKQVFAFLDEGTFQGEEGVKFSKILRGVAHKGGGGLTDLNFLGGGLGKKGWCQYFRVGLIPWRTLCCVLYFYARRKKII